MTVGARQIVPGIAKRALASSQFQIAFGHHRGKLFNGDGGIKANPVEGLMWLTIASRASVDTVDADWIEELLNNDMSVASPDQRKQAVAMADQFQVQFTAQN